MLAMMNEQANQHSVTRVAGNQVVQVWYFNASETVTLEIGAMTVNMEMSHFFAMHEMMRKAAAKLVMQQPLITEEKAVRKPLKVV